jgi:hypothetical protein
MIFYSDWVGKCELISIDEIAQNSCSVHFTCFAWLVAIGRDHLIWAA